MTKRRPFDPATYRSPLERRPDFFADPLPTPSGFSGEWMGYGLRGGVVAFMPAPDPRWTRRQLGAYTARRDANILGSCPSCDAKLPTIIAGRSGEGAMVHENDCLLHNDNLAKIIGTTGPPGR